MCRGANKPSRAEFSCVRVRARLILKNRTQASFFASQDPKFVNSHNLVSVFLLKTQNLYVSSQVFVPRKTHTPTKEELNLVD